jgi:ABC-type nickel/cobalt efflux system permease component RcnA
MSPEILLLCGTAATIAFVHTLAGPDHYLPFVALAKSGEWSAGTALRNTFICGSGHIAGSVLLGLAGIYASLHLDALQWIEGLRGDVAAWALVSFGLVYTAWSLRRIGRGRPHTRRQDPDRARPRKAGAQPVGARHTHRLAASAGQRRSLAGWAIFIVFILGPCEPLIPVLMLPAARESLTGLVAVTAVFAVVTVLTMVLAVALSIWGLGALRLPDLGRYSQAIAGGTITLCGLSMVALGL